MLKYYLFNVPADIKIVYCEKAETSKEGLIILKDFSPYSEWVKFNVNDYEIDHDGEEILNDSSLYVNSENEIYQVTCGNLLDCNGKVIPNTYRIRKVGIVL